MSYSHTHTHTTRKSVRMKLKDSFLVCIGSVIVNNGFHLVYLIFLTLVNHFSAWYLFSFWVKEWQCDQKYIYAIWSLRWLFKNRFCIDHLFLFIYSTPTNWRKTQYFFYLHSDFFLFCYYFDLFTVLHFTLFWTFIGGLKCCHSFPHSYFLSIYLSFVSDNRI